MTLKLATLNLCLGLKLKKDLVKNILLENNIQILCMQETEVELGFDEFLLSLLGFNLEMERNTVKARVAIYIDQQICYKRIFELEGEDNHIVILNLETGPTKRVINLDRSFNPVAMTAREKFKSHLIILKVQ